MILCCKIGLICGLNCLAVLGLLIISDTLTELSDVLKNDETVGTYTMGA